VSAAEDEAPCDRCPLRAHCKSELVACQAFLAFIQYKPWGAVERLPTRVRYEEVFPVPKARPVRPRFGRRTALFLKSRQKLSTTAATGT
jgi:hypothetical protein